MPLPAPSVPVLNNICPVVETLLRAKQNIVQPGFPAASGTVTGVIACQPERNWKYCH